MFPNFGVALVAALLASANADAQTAAATIAGVVRDSLGAAIPGATVRVVRSSTAEHVAELVSDEDGAYRSPALTAGSYRVEATLDGFDAVTRIVALDGSPLVVVADFTLVPERLTEAVLVTARRIEETVQDVPIPVSVVSGQAASRAGAFNVNRLKELVPTVQFYSTNPRNSAVNIRGLGAPFGLTNDGIEAGVGLYVDGVFYARPAAATLDFLDLERIEVLRGPQGVLFGKNTTAGALHVTTRKPTFRREIDLELSVGDEEFVQGKGSVSGPLTDKIAGRLSFSGTRRDGLIFNVASRREVNTLDNAGARGQLLVVPSNRVAITAAFDHTRQRPRGYTQVVAGVAPTLRNPNRQYAQIAADLNYTPPSFNAFDRLTDVDTPLRSNQELGGASVNLDWQVARGQVTSTTSWRYWNWDPSNDRDFIGLPVTPVSAAPSTQRQWTQEVRYAGEVSRRVNLIAGLFAFRQRIDSDPAFKQEQGSAAARFLLAPGAAAATPGLLDGYGFSQYLQFENVSAAAFGQLEIALTSRFRVLPGLRLNYDAKTVSFDQQVHGGLQTADPALIALQRSVLAPQAYSADVDDVNLSGQITLAYKIASNVNTYGTLSTGFKSIGLNLNGVPTDALDRPVLSAATVKPERVRHIEAGIKTEPLSGVTANLTLYNTDIDDFQAQVVNAGVGVLRGYLANAEKVRVRGVEFDGSARISRSLHLYVAGALTDGIYVSFPDAPPPLEETGGPQVKDVSGSTLPGISRWAASYGAEYSHPAALLHRSGELFAAIDSSYRSSFSSSASASRYLVVDGYSLLNARAGFRWSQWAVALWSRNLLNKDYFELLSAAPGNTGLFVGQPGERRSVGVTLRVGLQVR